MVPRRSSVEKKTPTMSRTVLATNPFGTISFLARRRALISRLRFPGSLIERIPKVIPNVDIAAKASKDFSLDEKPETQIRQGICAGCGTLGNVGGKGGFTYQGLTTCTEVDRG